MIYILIGVYLWAGLTIAYSFYLIDEIGYAINGKRLMPEKFLRWLGVILFWPIVLPIWVARDLIDLRLR